MILAVNQARPSLAIGQYVRRVREAREMSQKELARLAQMRPAQLSHLENGGNVEVKFYEIVAHALKFRNALEMFTSGGDPMTRQLLRLWRALPDDAAREDVLQQVKHQVVADGE